MTLYSLHDTAWAREARRRRLVDRPPPKAWRFNIGDQVRIWSGGAKTATVRGRSEFVDGPDRYEIEFIRSGAVVRLWMGVAEIMPV